MEKQRDILVWGRTGGNVRLVFADATKAARDLAASHLAGPAASEALAEGLAAAALLCADLGTPQEAATLQLKTDGPISSLLVEATFEGTLRGYTGKKILNDFDGEGEMDMDAVFGGHGSCNVMVSLPGSILSQSATSVVPPRPANALGQYYGLGAQRPVAVAVAVERGAGGLACARGFLAEKMPGCDDAEFGAIAAAVSGEGFRARLAGAAGAAALFGGLAAGGVAAPETRPLRFACHCSHDRAVAALRALPEGERMELAARGADIDIFCHMCGKCHTIQPDELEKLEGRM